jgi:hypothetical protein
MGTKGASIFLEGGRAKTRDEAKARIALIALDPNSDLTSILAVLLPTMLEFGNESEQRYGNNIADAFDIPEDLRDECLPSAS